MICKRTRIGAYGLICQDQQILLCRLAPSVREVSGHWTLPGGGVEFGEHPTDAMIREVREETGLEVRADALAGVDSLCTEVDATAWHSVRIVYFTTVTGGQLRAETDGTTDACEWMDLARLRSEPLVSLAEFGLRHLHSLRGPATAGAAAFR